MTDENETPKVNSHAHLSGVVGSAFSKKQKASLLYTIRQIIDHTERTILVDSSILSDEEILKRIEEDFFGK